MIWKIKNKKATFKYEKKGILCLGVTKIEILDVKLTGKCCTVFDYTGENLRQQYRGCRRITTYMMVTDL